MNNVQSVGNSILKNQSVPEVKTKQGNLYRVNFKAGENDKFVRQSGPQRPVYTQPPLLNPQDQMSRMLSEQEKAQKKEKRKNNILTAIAALSGIAIIAMAIRSFRGGKAMNEEFGIQSFEQLKKDFLKDVSGAKALDDLHLPKSLKDTTDNIVNGIKNIEEATAKGGEGLKTIFLYGPPGTGKTSYAQGIAKKLGADFYQVDMAKLKKPLHGVTEANIDSTFGMVCKEADKLLAEKSDKRLIVFLDEIDSVMMEDLGNGSKLSNDVLNQFKISFNELLKRKNITVIGASNLEIDSAKAIGKSLDPAMLSRFKEKVLVDRPTSEQIRHTIADHYKNCSMVDDIFKSPDGTIEELSNFLAEKRHETSFRTLESIFDKAYLKSEKGKNVTIEDFVDAIIQKADDLKLTDADIKELKNMIK